MNRIRSRSGSGAPASVSSGSASAAASETAPRIPAQADTIRGRAAHPPFPLRGPAIQRPDHVGHREHEDEAGADHGGADKRRVADQLAGRIGVEAIRYHRQLQPDQDEQRGVEEEDEDLPDGKALQARLRRDQLGAPPAQVDAGGDGRQHAREAELVGGDEGGVGRQQRDRDLGRRVVDPAPDLGDQESDHQPDRDPAGGRSHELEPRVERREAPAHRGGHGHPVGHERGRVVHEALALDDVHEPARGADLAHDRRGGHRIGRRDDRAERKGQRPREPDRLVRRSRRRPRSSRAPGRSTPSRSRAGRCAARAGPRRRRPRTAAAAGRSGAPDPARARSPACPEADRAPARPARAGSDRAPTASARSRSGPRPTRTAPPGRSQNPPRRNCCLPGGCGAGRLGR